MGSSHGAKKKRRDVILGSVVPFVSDCEIERFVGWIQPTTTMRAFYDKLTKNETTRWFDINHPSKKNQWTLLHFACDASNFKIVRALCHAGANINARAKSDITPLDIALERNNLKLVDYLVSRGACTWKGISRYLKIDSKNNDEIASLQEYLLVNNLKDQAYNFFTHETNEFIKKVQEDRIDSVKRILEVTKVTLHNPYLNVTPILHQAILNNSLPMVTLLVRHGALIVEDDWGTSSFELAFRNKFYDIATFLDNTQKLRYKRLKDHVNFEEKYPLLILGFFKANRDIARKIINTTYEIEAKSLSI